MGAMQSIRLWIAVVVTPYVLLSFLFYGVEYSPPVQSMLGAFTGFLWLLGPPALLLVNLGDSWHAYLLGSTAVLSSAFLTLHLVRRGDEWEGVLIAACTAAIWFGFGLLIYLAQV